MVGGEIRDVYMFDDRLSLLVRGTGCESSDLRCIDVTLEAALKGVSRYDTIWWQGAIALWTPKLGTREDVHLERIGFSYDPKYLWPRVAALCRAGICPECGNDQGCMHDGEGALWCPRCGASLMMGEGEVGA